MYIRPDALASKQLLERLPFRHSHDILMENVIGARAASRSNHTAAESIVINLSDFLTASIIVGQPRQLGQKNRGLQFVKTAVRAWNLAHVALPPTKFAQHPYFLGDRWIVCGDCAAVTKRAKVLSWVEAESRSSP